MGLVPAGTPGWRARFIAEAHHCRTGDPAPYFRRQFTVERGLTSATLYITGLGIVAPELNGRPVGDQVLLPGWTTYDARLMVSAFDVTADLSEGANTLGAIVGQGWAAGPFLFDKSMHHYCDRPALYMQLDLHYGGRIAAVLTGDEGWQVGHGAVRANSLYDGETYDARREPGEWSPASPFTWDLSTLCATETPPVRRQAWFHPVSITPRPDGTTIVDFGQNISGWVHLRLNNPRPGQEVTIRHAEVLTPEGDLETETNRTALATDHYIARGDAIEQWEPRFTYHGFRYVEIDGWPNADVGDFTAVAIWSDMARRGWFESSHQQLNQCHTNTLWSMRDNFVSIPTDCPQRDERLGWTGDLNAFLPTAAYLYDVRAVVTSWLDDLMIAQRRVGNMPRQAPLIDPRPSQPTALWGDAIVNVPLQLYLEYGDLAILWRCWGAMRSFVDEVAALLSGDGLWDTGFQYGDWCDPDAPPTEPGQGKTDRHLVAQAFFARTAAQMADIATLLGEPSEVYARLAQRTRRAFIDRYVRGGVVCGDCPHGETPTGYALAICFGLLPPDDRATAGARLSQLVACRHHVIATGFAGTPFILDALTTSGHIDDAYAMLLQPDCPGFLYPVSMGATTTWERWDAILPDGRLHKTGMTSLNHYALGSIHDWVHRVVGGLARGAPGWARVIVAPRPGGGLTAARTTHITPFGAAEVSWRIVGSRFSVEATIPRRVQGQVELPGQTGSPIEVGPGEHHWSCKV